VNRVCQIATNVFLVIYLLALVAFLVGVFGLFGQEPDPMSGIFLIPLGLPWNRLVDLFPEPLWPWLAAAAPLLNYVLLRLICRILVARKLP
jgi:hypothetical protein